MSKQRKKPAPIPKSKQIVLQPVMRKELDYEALASALLDLAEQLPQEEREEAGRRGAVLRKKIESDTKKRAA